MAVPTYQTICEHHLTTSFGMNEVSFLRFSEEKRYHLTAGLNSCFAIFLFSPVASVGAHIAPHPGTETQDLQAGNKNLIVKLREFAALYKAHKDCFDPNYKVCLVFAALHGKSVMPDKKAFIEKCLAQFGVDFPMQDYEVKSSGQPRPPEHGTVFVDGGAKTGTTLYIEDKVFVRLHRQPSTPDDVAAAQASGVLFPKEPKPLQKPQGQ